MIVMLIADAPGRERKEVLALAKDVAACRTEDRWVWLESGTVSELNRWTQVHEMVDMFCLDLTIPGLLDIVPELRNSYPDSYMILIADGHISPVRYLRPQIRAGSLLLKPLRRSSVKEVFEEAMQAYLGIEKDEKTRMFVIESHGERSFISYQRINYFESREKKIFLCTDSEEFAFYDTLDELARKLEGRFLRTHRSFLISRNKIASILINQNRVVIRNGAELPISRSYKGTVRECLRVTQT